MLIDPGFSKLGQRFIGLFLFAQRGVQQLGGLTQAEFSGPRPERPVTGDFIVLDCLGQLRATQRPGPACP